MSLLDIASLPSNDIKGICGSIAPSLAIDADNGNVDIDLHWFTITVRIVVVIHDVINYLISIHAFGSSSALLMLSSPTSKPMN
jgi:hypothetical protein